MSAILGRIALDGRPVDEPVFGAAFRALAPWGGDGGGVRIDGAAALGQHHRQVARNRPAEGRPLREGALSVVADAILDNRDELAAALRLAPAEARDLPDSRLILKAFRAWGEEAPHHLLGDFAFAIWDSDRRRLFLARDHIGARPLHWARRRSTVVLATDVTALLAFRDLGWQIDEAAVARYLMQPDIPPAKGFLRDQFTVPPGGCVTIEGDAVSQSLWWDPATVSGTAAGSAAGDAAQLRALIEAAVTCRIDTDLPVGSHLSGGIDSTAVAVLAGRALRTEGRHLTRAYSWSPPVGPAWPEIGAEDERHRVGAICENEGLSCRFLDADLGLVKRMALRRPIETEGIADVSEELAVIAAAREDGIGVMLSGWGGDEAVSAHGFGYLAHLVRHGRLREAVGTARRHAGGFRRAGTVVRTLLRHGVLPLMPDAVFARFAGQPEVYPEHCFLSARLLERSGLPRRRGGPLVRETADPVLYLRRLIGFGHLAARMQTWAVWAAPAGIAYRYPLTDRRLLEYLLSLPVERLFARGAPRALMRAALADVLPARMPKADPVQQAMRDRMRRDCWQQLKDDPLLAARACPWLDMPRLQARLAAVPADEITCAMQFAELSGAVRVLDLHGRWQATCSRDLP